MRGLDEFTFPGWIPVPAGMSPDAKGQWLRDAELALGGIVGVQRWDGEPTSREHVRGLLGRALEEVEAVDAAATFQVWPLPGPAAVICRVMLLTSDSVPKWESGDDGARHLIESKRLGVGLQSTSRTRVETGNGAVEFEAVDLIFNDGNGAIVLTVEPTFAPMLVNTLPGLVALMDTIWLERPDGTTFSGVAPTGVLADDSWEVEVS